MDERRSRLILYALIALGAIDHLLLLTRFIFHHTGTDEVVMWEMARDYGRGIFREPYMYGQNYNVMLEALLGAPFVRMGIAPWIINPLFTSLLSIAPYWSFAIWHGRKKEMFPACLFAAMPLLLPVEHGLNLTAVNGIAVLACYPWVQSMRPSPLRSILLGAVLAAALFVNPNALVLIVPLGVFSLLNARSWMAAPRMLLGAAPIVLAWHFSQRFYAADPNRVMNTIFDWRMTFHPELLPEAFGRLDAHFQWLAPVFWSHGQVSFWMLPVITTLLLFQGKRAAATALLSALVLIVLSLAFPKTHDGTSSFFFPLSRMFLAMPLLLAWALARVADDWRAPRWSIASIALAGFVATVIRADRSKEVFEHALAHQDGLPVRTRSIASLRTDCERLASFASSTGADLVVTLRHPDVYTAQFLSCACPTLEPGLPPTYMPGGDRRAWRRVDAGQRIPRRLLFVNGIEEAWRTTLARDPRVVRVSDEAPVLHRMEQAAGPVDSLAIGLGVISALK